MHHMSRLRRMVFHHRVVIRDRRFLWASHENHKGVPQEKYQQAIVKKLTAPNSSIRGWSICKYKAIAYADNKLKPRKIITPMHFLSMNQKVGLPATVNNHEDDPNYNNNKLSSSEKLLEIWKEGQIHLTEFRKIHESDYLLNSRERNQI